jgi:hypothetical protein
VEYLHGDKTKAQMKVKAGSNVRYVNPGKLNVERENKIYLRSLIVKNDAVLELKIDKQIVKTIKKNHVQPSEMINLNIGPKELEGFDPESILEFSII